MWEAAANIVQPGLGTALKALHVSIKLVSALESFNVGRGVKVEIPVADVVGDLLSVAVTIRIGEAEPPPLPELDGATRPADAVAMAASGGDLDRLQCGVGTDLELLVRHAAERAYSAGGQGESWSWLVAAYLDPRARTGRLAAGYRNAPYLVWIDLAATKFEDNQSEAEHERRKHRSAR